MGVWKIIPSVKLFLLMELDGVHSSWLETIWSQELGAAVQVK